MRAKEEDGGAVRHGSGRMAVRLGEKEPHPIVCDHRKTCNSRQRDTRRGKEVRERILNAALECFSAFGFNGTSTRFIASRANEKNTLVLYHFGSKDQLWLSTMDAALNGYIAQINECIEESAKISAAMALRTFIELFIRISSRKPQIHRILTMESNQDTTRLHWLIKHHLRKHFEKVVGLIRLAQQEGKVRQCDPARLYYMIIGAGGIPLTLSGENHPLKVNKIISKNEVDENIDFIFDIVFESNFSKIKPSL